MQEHSGQWNLPGGHLVEHECLAEGATREDREETGLDVEVDYLIGVYTGFGASHLTDFAFHAMNPEGIPTARDRKVSNLKWFTPLQILDMPDDEVLNPKKMKRIVKDFLGGRVVPLDVITEGVHGT